MLKIVVDDQKYRGHSVYLNWSGSEFTELPIKDLVFSCLSEVANEPLRSINLPSPFSGYSWRPKASTNDELDLARSGSEL